MSSDEGELAALSPPQQSEGEDSSREGGRSPDLHHINDHQIVPEERGPSFSLKNLVTPSTEHNQAATIEVDDVAKRNVRRSLFTTTPKRPAPVTPAHQEFQSPAKRKLVFGRFVEKVAVQDNVRQVYAIIKKLTGDIGGNASHGPIYGELTMVSMQKMVNLMKEHAEFNSTSRFIDVGSGIGKPNLHVAQDPGVEISYGIEVEEPRWLLGMTCLKGVLDASSAQEHSIMNTQDHSRIRHRCIFQLADIRQAKTFDPFTHVYMFSIGFPPKLWVDLATMWNRSQSRYLICYHPPKDIVSDYGFHVVLLNQTSTSMHGSKEIHTGYIYKRNETGGTSSSAAAGACDPFFANVVDKVSSLVSLRAEVDSELQSRMSHGPSTRTRRRLKS